MNKINLVGVDVGAKTLVITIERSADKKKVCANFDNSLVGHKKLHKFVTKNGAKARVCMEATGIYHFSLALYLHKAKNIELMIANPRAIKNFSEALMTRAKTDLVDSEVILQYVKRMDFKAWEPPSDNVLHIQAISRRMHQLKNEITREKNRSHANEYNPIVEKIIKNDVAVNLKHLQKRVALLEKKAFEVIQADSELENVFNILTSIKGIARTSAIQILSELMCLPADMQAKQWVAYTGLDPRPIESGSSINKPRRISKSGNKYLRTALYMPAWVAVQNDIHVKAFYEKLINLGKKPMQAIIAVMRKLLHAIWGMLKSNSEWQGEKFYVIPDLETA